MINEAIAATAGETAFYMSKLRERDTGYSRDQAVINSDAVHFD